MCRCADVPMRGCGRSLAHDVLLATPEPARSLQALQAELGARRTGVAMR